MNRKNLSRDARRPDEKLCAVINGRLIVPDNRDNFVERRNAAIIFDEKIRDILPMDNWSSVSESIDTIFDAQNNFVAPGFVNIHVHGSVGHDTMDADEKGLAQMADFQAKTGVTAFLPTTMTMGREEICAALTAVRSAGIRQKSGAKILGAHAEGPFISRDFCGAQDPAKIVPVDFSLFAPFADTVKIITFAPETVNDTELDDFLRQCREHDIVPSIGHTAATTEKAAQALKQGAKSFTHLFNAMSGVHHRKGGAALAALTTDATAELIADNIHVSPAAQKLVWLAKGGKNIALITDSLRACGLGDGESELGGQKVFVKGDLATLANGTIAGSVLAMNRAVKNFLTGTGAPLPQIIAAATKTPASLIGEYERRGSLAVGKYADIVVFDESINIKSVFVCGIKQQ